MFRLIKGRGPLIDLELNLGLGAVSREKNGLLSEEKKLDEVWLAPMLL